MARSYDPSQGLRLPPRVRDLTIDYTALSLVAPEKVHFRFKLEGQDEDWREVVNERRVRVLESAAGKLPLPRDRLQQQRGVERGRRVPGFRRLRPAYYQTNWFRALCAAAFLALLWVAYQLRVRQLRRQERKLRDVIETIPTFAWTALPDGSMDFANRHWEEYTGFVHRRGRLAQVGKPPFTPKT